MEGVTVYDHVPECHVTLGRGGLHNVWWDTYIDHRTSRKSHRSQNKTLIRGASPGIPYELWDKHTICWRRWNIATQKKKVCDMEVEIVAFVIKRSAQLTVPPDRQELIQVGSRGVALILVFYIKLSGIHLAKIIMKIWIIDQEYVINVSICEVELRC